MNDLISNLLFFLLDWFLSKLQKDVCQQNIVLYSKVEATGMMSDINYSVYRQVFCNIMFCDIHFDIIKKN